MELTVRTVTGTGIFCFTSSVIASGRQGISLMARARGPEWPEGANIVKSTFSDLNLKMGVISSLKAKTHYNHH